MPNGVARRGGSGNAGAGKPTRPLRLPNHPNPEVQCEAKPLSVGLRTRAGSIRNPRAWAYSTKAWLNRGSSRSACSTMAEVLSGMTTAKTPWKKAHAASKPAITASVVWRKLSHTKQCRL